MIIYEKYLLQQSIEKETENDDITYKDPFESCSLVAFTGWLYVEIPRWKSAMKTKHSTINLHLQNYHDRLQKLPFSNI